MNGRCQGFYCAATVSAMMAAAQGLAGGGRAGGPGPAGPAAGRLRVARAGPAGVNVDVLIAGAGPAGLAAGIELRRLGVGRVLVVDREAEAGGVPRHSAHTGYRAARPAPGHDRAGLRPALCAGRRRGGRRGTRRNHGHRLARVARPGGPAARYPSP